MKGSPTAGTRLVTMVTKQSDLTETHLTRFHSRALVTVSASFLQRREKSDVTKPMQRGFAVI